MKICKDFKNKIVDFIENQLVDEEYKKFEVHLRQCDKCQREYLALKNLYKVLDRDEVILPENEFFDNLKAKVRQKEIILHRPYVFKTLRVLVPIFAVAIILLFLQEPQKTTEVIIPVANLLDDQEVASYALSRVIDDNLISELSIVEDYFPMELDEIIDELNEAEIKELIRILNEKYDIDT